MDHDDSGCPPGALPLLAAMQQWLPAEVVARVRAAGDDMNQNARQVYHRDEQGRRIFEIDAESDHNRPLLLRVREAQDAAEVEFLALLRAGRLIAWGRDGSPMAALRRIPADAWVSLRLAHVTEGRVRGASVDIYGIHIAPAAEPAECSAASASPTVPTQPLLPTGGWWTAGQALAWLAFDLPQRLDDARQPSGTLDKDADHMARAQRQLSDAIAARTLPAWGQETTDVAKAPMRDTLVLIPPEDFAGPSALTVQMNGWAFPPTLGRRYEGRWWQGIMFEAAEVRRAFGPPEPATEAAAEHLATHAAPPPKITSTGAAGRPTSMHLIRPEHQRRLDAGEADGAVAVEARRLAAWFSETHPEAPQPTSKAIENSIRDSHRRRATRPPK